MILWNFCRFVAFYLFDSYESHQEYQNVKKTTNNSAHFWPFARKCQSFKSDIATKRQCIFLYTDIRCRGNEERERKNAGLKFREQDEEKKSERIPGARNEIYTSQIESVKFIQATTTIGLYKNGIGWMTCIKLTAYHAGQWMKEENAAGKTIRLWWADGLRGRSFEQMLIQESKEPKRNFVP